MGFCTPGSVAWPGSNVIDVVPGDLVTSVTLATGAAVLLKAPAARLQQQQREMYKIGTGSCCCLPLSAAESLLSDAQHSCSLDGQWHLPHFATACCCCCQHASC